MMIHAPISVVERTINRWNQSRSLGLVYHGERHGESIWGVGNCLIIACDIPPLATEVQLSEFKGCWADEEALNVFNLLGKLWAGTPYLETFVPLRPRCDPPIMGEVAHPDWRMPDEATWKAQREAPITYDEGGRKWIPLTDEKGWEEYCWQVEWAKNQLQIRATLSTLTSAEAAHKTFQEPSNEQARGQPARGRSKLVAEREAVILKIYEEHPDWSYTKIATELLKQVDAGLIDKRWIDDAGNVDEAVRNAFRTNGIKKKRGNRTR